jgi:hypothetical protein
MQRRYRSTFQQNIQAWEFPSDTLSYMYDHTFDKSLKRKYLVDFSVEKINMQNMRDIQSQYPKDFLFELVEELVARDVKQSYLKKMERGRIRLLEEIEDMRQVSRLLDFGSPSTTRVSCFRSLFERY